jgi:hypothetical protein
VVGKVIKTPFPYFGGKLKAASLIWSRLGADCGNYIEPFFGSGAVCINRPDAFSGWLTVNDLDGNVANFWRAMQQAPDAVAEASCWPVSECDLHARHLWLVNNLPKLAPRLMADPDYCEPRTAGWWAWGACLWIGSGWCDGSGPWHSEPDAEGVATFTLGDGGKGVKATFTLGDGGKGVNRQLPHLGNGGTGVNRQLPHLGDGGTGVNRQLDPMQDRLEWLQNWFRQIQYRLADVRVCCGDWERICSIGSMTRNGICGVLFDPPYSTTGAVYAQDSSTVAGDVLRWCEVNGGNPGLRVALCGHDTEHNALESQGWTVETWDKAGGYQGADDRERIWFSPHCKQDGRQQTLNLGV